MDFAMIPGELALEACSKCDIRCQPDHFACFEKTNAIVKWFTDRGEESDDA